MQKLQTPCRSASCSFNVLSCHCYHDLLRKNLFFYEKAECDFRRPQFEQEKKLSGSGLSSEILEKVKSIVRDAVHEHWVLDGEAKVKSDVTMDLKKSILDDTKTMHQDLVDTYVREAVSAAVNSKAPSQVVGKLPILVTHLRTH